MKASRQGKWARRSRSEWGWLVARFGESGLGVRSFCRREGVSAASFYRWRAVLGNGGEQRRAVVVRNTAPAFVDAGPLGLPRAQPLSGRLDLRLDLGDGVVLHLVRS